MRSELRSLLDEEVLSTVDQNILRIDGNSYDYDYLAIDISALSLPKWLQAQTIYPKVYWRDRVEEVECAALGSLLSFSHIPSISSSSSPQARLYGGRQFGAGEPSSSWESFPSCHFWLPQFEVIQTKERTQLIIHFLNQNPDPSFMQQLHFENSALSEESYPILQRSDYPSILGWEEGINRSLELIRINQLEKVVLARKTHFRSENKIDPFTLLDRLKAKTKKTTLFAFQFNTGSAFIGATPEKLYERQGNFLQTDALAGTRPVGLTAAENALLEYELLSSCKETREFAFVKDFIQEALEPLCHDLKWEAKDHVICTTNVQHLYNNLSAHLKPEVSDSDLIQTLHPTPALGGVPRQNAIDFIERQEPFHRGWYGAPIGWISSQAADIAVAIRSALIKGSEIELFAGTGIVAGSEAFEEWEELEQKIDAFKELLY